MSYTFEQLYKGDYHIEELFDDDNVCYVNLLLRLKEKLILITMSYGKYLLELHLGRLLPEKLKIIHLDNDNINFELTNLNFRIVHGPYFRQDGRQHVLVVIKDHNNKEVSRRVVSYPKFLKEEELGYTLDKDQTIDHNDRDINNNDLSNLIIRPRSEHSQLDVTRVKVDPIKCAWCKKEFLPTKDQISTRSNKKAGPFCNRKCSGNYGAKVRSTNKRWKRNPVKKNYYRLNKT